MGSEATWDFSQGEKFDGIKFLSQPPGPSFRKPRRHALLLTVLQREGDRVVSNGPCTSVLQWRGNDAFGGKPLRMACGQEGGGVAGQFKAHESTMLWPRRTAASCLPRPRSAHLSARRRVTMQRHFGVTFRMSVKTRQKQ